MAAASLPPEGITAEAPVPAFLMAELLSSKEVEENTRRELFKHAMKGHWDKVLIMYRDQAFAREAEITRAKDTVLHLAVSEGKTDVIWRLVQAIGTGEEAATILNKKNERWDTPLHLAAALGKAEACEILASKFPTVIVDARNREGETPLFVAARYGKKEAFFALQDHIPMSSGVRARALSYCRNNSGDTILHAAINGEHLALAFEIIHLYPDFVDYNNERGQSALHLLANKPAVFKSGSHMRRLDRLIYPWIIVDRLKVKHGSKNIRTNGEQQKENGNKLPENYKTCFGLFRIIAKAFHSMVASFQGCHWKNICNDRDEEDPKDTKSDEDQRQSNGAKLSETRKAQPQLPENYKTCFQIFKITMKILFIILGIGLWRIEKIKRKKKGHMKAQQLMEELVSRASQWSYEEGGKEPYGRKDDSRKEQDKPDPYGREDDSRKDIRKTAQDKPDQASLMDILDTDKKILSTLQVLAEELKTHKSQEKDMKSDQPEKDTPILVAAKMGVLEMVKKILATFPVAVEDLDSDDKNIVLLAVESRQTHVYQYMLKRKKMKESIFGRVDKKGNSALHLAARCGQISPWMVTGAALQMQWEVKWYKFVKDSVEPGFFPHQNSSGRTAREIFNQSHKSLLKEGGEWLTKTSESCSVVAALIATVAYTSATSVPGGLKQDSGFPILEGQPAFSVFAISALVALCFSVTSLVMFLAILTSRHHEKDFEKDLPVKVIIGLTSLFMSIAAMLVSFCAGHFYVIEMKLKYAAYPIYAVTCLPISFFAFVQFPLYIDLIKATIADVPERSYKTYAF